MTEHHDAGQPVLDVRFVEWLDENALLQRFLSQTAEQAAAWADASDLVTLDRLPKEIRSEITTLCERHRRETRALRRHRAPPEGFRSAHMAFWAAAGRMMGRLDASRHSSAKGPQITAILGHALDALTRQWRAFGDYEVRSLVDVRYEEFRIRRATRYHYWRARVGSYAVEWTAGARPEETLRVHEGVLARVEREKGLSHLFVEWLDEERNLREAALEWRGRPLGAELCELIGELVCQELRWRGIEGELEKRALWHASQREARSELLVALRLGRIGSYDPEFAEDDRGLLALSKLGRLACFSETGHRSLSGEPGWLPIRAAEA